MKGIWAGGLSLSLGWLAATAVGQDMTGYVPGERPAVIAQSGEQAAGRALPVTLGKPIAVTPEVAPGTITPVSYQPALGRNPPADPPPPSPPEGAWLSSNAPTPTSPAGFASDNARIRPTGYPTLPASDGPSLGLDAPLGGHMLPPVPDDGFAAPGPVGGPASRVYGGAEYLLWWIKDAKLPPLVTTSPPSSAGILGMPGTVVLFGGSSLDNGDFSGGRFTVGFWLDACHEKAIEFTGFFLGERSVGFSANSSQFPVIARPFFDLNSGMEFSQVTASPGLSTGSINVLSSSNLWGTEANLRCKACCGCNYRVDLLAGFRYLELDESLSIRESIDVLPGVPMFGGDHIDVLDSFSTHNRFYGGQVGVDAEVNRGKWFADFRGKVALGDTRQVIRINGGQAVTTPAGVTSTFLGGLLALPTNIGHFHRDEFGFVPELGVNIGYQFNDHWRAFVGYSFLYWSSVVRPGDQIDRVIDVTKIPNFSTTATPAPQARPAVLFRDTEFWAQGVNFGLEFRY